MKRRYLANIIVCLFISSMGFAQTSPSTIIEDFKPSSVNQPGQEYPQVNSQGYARFKIIAPSADSVRVSLGLGGRGGTKLTKMADTTWMGTTEGLWMKVFIITMCALTVENSTTLVL